MGMTQEKGTHREVKMPLLRSAESLDALQVVYSANNNGTKKLRSYFLSSRHQDIIDLVAEHTGKSKAEVVRDIIDEWADEQLRGKAQ